MSGKKYDTGKIPIHLVPFAAIEACASVLAFGRDKYGEWNWAGGFDWSRLYSACQRHLGEWWQGDDLDKETGMSHLWHALCCVVFLVMHEKYGLGRDDRCKLFATASATEPHTPSPQS